MFRPDNYGYRSQTMTQTINPPSSTTTGTSTRTSTVTATNTHNDSVIFAIVTGNLNEVKRLVNISNINNVIDTKNRYTALHYAVKLPNNEIVEYLMNCGANTSIKQNEGKDAIDLSIEANKRFLVDRVIKDATKEADALFTKYDDINYKSKSLERENKQLKETNQYLEKVSAQHVEKIEQLKKENTNVKRKLEESETAFSNLLKKTKKENK